MSALQETTPREVARRALLRGSWHAVVAHDDDLARGTQEISDELERAGVSVVREDLTLDIGRLSRASERRPETALLVVGRGVDERTWCALEMSRSRLEGLGMALFVLSARSAETLSGAAPHLKSWLSDMRQLNLRSDAEELLRTGRIRQAREALRFPGASHQDKLADVLAPPTTSRRPSSAPGDFAANVRWIQEHRAEFARSWVALRDGALVDHDKSRIALQRRLTEQEALSAMLIVLVEE